MHRHAEIRHSPYAPAQLYALVIDVLRYPEFLPWCRAARVIERNPEHFLAELIISFSGFTESYISKVVGDEAAQRIEVSLVSGPFNTLANHWRFEAAPQGGTNIHFAVEFAFKSRLLNSMMGGLFGRAVDKMGEAFITRADALYGPAA